jgi:alpha-amylase/alpha-mannosidase (GH57 family)
VLLPSGRSIAIFFYDGPTSNAIAFGELGLGGESLARRLAGLFSESSEPQLAHAATDGETYGHHFRGGELVLAEALRFLESEGLARLTNYGEFLESHPPAFEAEITENTSWSCAHGIGRWREACGCATGEHPGWSQAWRGPLRQALDWLRDELAVRFETAGRMYFRDPWAARDESLPVLSGGEPEDAERFFATQSRGMLGEDARRRALRLLEMQRYAMLMFASCGWFFDDPAGLETRQILRFAARAIELAEGPGADRIEAEFLDILTRLESNDPEAGSGPQIYESSVKSKSVVTNSPSFDRFGLT